MPKFKTAKAALCKALLDGYVLNVSNVFKTIGLSNCSREIGRSIVRDFGAEVQKIPRTAKTRYGQTAHYYDYKLVFSQRNRKPIKEMKKYVVENTI
jgi:hypothetical protein